MLQGISSTAIAGYTRVTSRPNFGGEFQTAVAADRFEMSSSSPALVAQESSLRSRSEVLGKLKQFSSTPDETPKEPAPQHSNPVGEQLGWLLAGHPTW